MSEQAAEQKRETLPEGQAKAKERDVKLDAAKARVEVEAKAIAEMILKEDSAAGHKFLKLGEKCWKYTLKADAAGYNRKDSRGMLEAEILLAVRVDYSKEITRAIKVYHTHAILGEGVLGLPLDMVKALSTFVQEDQQTGEWGLDPRHADAVTKLYNRVINGKGKRLTAKDFRAELNRIVNPNVTSATSKSDRVSPAGERSVDLGVPPIRPLQGSAASPGNTAIAITKALEQAEDELAACRVAGQKLALDNLIAIVAGFAEGLLQEEDLSQAEADWDYFTDELEPYFSKVRARFGSHKGE